MIDEMNTVVEGIIGDTEATCDPARALRCVLDLLVAADVDEQDDDESDEALDRKSVASTTLFCLATRWRARRKKKEAR